MKLSRRGFVKGAGLAAGAAALLEGAAGKEEQGRARKLGPGAVDVTLASTARTTGSRWSRAPRWPRCCATNCHLTGTKIGCDRGACGACTVMLGEHTAASCMTFALDAVGKPVTTIEGLASGSRLAPIQAAFVAHDALQCGFCTPGMVMSCHALLQQNPHPSEDDVRRAVAGNTCRCGTYPKVFEAALAAAGTAPVQAGPAQGELPSSVPAEAAAAKDSSELADRTFQVGLAGALSAKERKAPASEPTPWDGSANLRVVGQRVPRIDGAEKVTGRARYAFDVQLPGMLYAAVVRSPHAHARIKSVEVSAAAAMPGVQATYVVERILGPAELKVKPVSGGKHPSSATRERRWRRWRR